MKKLGNKILLVDDNVFNRILLSEILEILERDYDEGSSGKEAIEKIKTGKYGLVFLDVEMPNMNGFEAVEHVKKQLGPPYNQTVIVAITAHDPETFKEEYKSSPFDDLIAKPYSQDKVKNILDKFKI